MYKLSKSAIRSIHKAVDLLFDKAKARIIGPHSMPKGIEIRVNPEYTLQGLYEAAAASDGAKADEATLDGILKIAESYIDAAKERAKAQTVHVVQSTLRSNPDTNLRTVLGGHLSVVWDKTTNTLGQIVASESNSAKNIGTMEGITKANAFQGVMDPVVFFVVVKDQALCEECIRLHLMPDRMTPKLWYLSEVGHGYHKKGEDNPKINGLHPHCRCQISTLMPGYGFDGIGHVTYVARGHNEIERQRSVEKSEDWEDLLKSTKEGLKHFQVLADWAQRNQERYLKNGGNYAFRPISGTVLKHYQDSPVVIHIPSQHLEDIAKRGRMLNLFDTGHGQGSTYFPDRLEWEDTNFGFVKNLNDHPATERPIYGALMPAHHVEEFERGSRATGPAPSYGDTYVQLKEHVKNRCTFTPGDSSNTDGSDIGTIAHLHRVASKSHYDAGHDIYTLPPRGSLHDYVEAQIHGGVYTKEDIESIHLPGRKLENGPSSTLTHRWYDSLRRLKRALHFAKVNGIDVFEHLGDRNDPGLPIVTTHHYTPPDGELSDQAKKIASGHCFDVEGKKWKPGKLANGRLFFRPDPKDQDLGVSWHPDDDWVELGQVAPLGRIGTVPEEPQPIPDDIPPEGGKVQ